MARGEPQTEQEAQELRRFLERGARVGLEAERRVSSTPARVTPAQPVSVEIVDAAAALEEFEEAPQGDSDEVRVEFVAILELEFAPTGLVPEYSVNLFVNKRDVGRQTGPEDPAFIGSLAFFCHAELRNGELVCVIHDEDPIVFRFPVEREKLQTPGRAPLTVTLVPVPFEGRTPQQNLDVTVTLEIARSEYVPPS